MIAVARLSVPVALLVLLAACASGKRHTLDQPADTTPYLRLVEVRLEEGLTRVRFTYRAPGQQSRRIGVHPPAHPGAFEIVTLDDKVYPLIDVEGIAVLPEQTLVPGGSSVSFELLFKPIPDDTEEFSIGEGNYDSGADESAWYFDQVKLK